MADNETEILRQARVFASGLLAREGDKRLQAIVEEAAEEFRVPIAAISVIDRGRQFFPVSVGLDVRETERTVSFCRHAIDTPGSILCVPDALDDARFAANPLVTGPMRIRFYAGYPLAPDDQPAIGTLCLIDRVARPSLTSDEQARLQAFGERCLAEVEAGWNLVRYGQQAIELILRQIETAVGQGNDRLVEGLDAILQTMERGVTRNASRARPLLPRDISGQSDRGK